MIDNFDASLKQVLKWEGGKSDHPDDPGGATNQGITLKTYQQHVPGATKENLWNMGDVMRDLIYRTDYWNPIKGNDLPYGIDCCVFDAAVNSGPARSVMWLQEIVGTAADGIIGPITLAAVKDYDDDVVLIINHCDKRMAFLEQLSTWTTSFGNGWTNRIDDLRDVCCDMVHREHHTEQQPTEALTAHDALMEIAAIIERYTKP